MKEIVYTPHNTKSVLTDFDIGDTLNNPISNPILARNRLSNTNIQPYQNIYSETTSPEVIEVSEIVEETPVKTSSIQKVSHSRSQGGQKANVAPALQGVLNIFDKYGIGYNVTSGHRPGATTAQGKQSFHATGSAIDITPQGMTYEDLKERIKRTPEIQEYFRQNKLGILDETTPGMLKRTGGTGAHWHIGPDKIAIETFKQWYGKKGGQIRRLAKGDKIVYKQHNPIDEKINNSVSVPLNFDVSQGQPRGYVPEYNIPIIKEKKEVTSKNLPIINSVEFRSSMNDDLFKQYINNFEGHGNTVTLSKDERSDVMRPTGKYGLTMLIDDNGKKIRDVKEGEYHTDEEWDRYYDNYNKMMDITLKKEFTNFDNYSVGLQYAIRDASRGTRNFFKHSKSKNFYALMEKYNNTLDSNLLPQIAKEANWSASNTGWLGVRSRMRQAMILDKLDPEDLQYVSQSNEDRTRLRNKYTF